MHSSILRKLLVALGAVTLTALLAYAQLGPQLANRGLTAFGNQPGDLPAVSSGPPDLSATADPAAEAASGLEALAGLDDAMSEEEREEIAEARKRALREAALEQIASERASVRRRGAERLSTVGGEEAEKELRRLALSDLSSGVRSAAVSSLRELEATEALVEIASETEISEETRLEALEEIEDLKPLEDDAVDEFESMTTSALLEALEDPSTDVYERAASMLEDMDDPAVVSSLWDKFFRHAEGDFERAEVLLDLLEFLDQETDEARDYLDYYDPTDWDRAAAERVARVHNEGWTELDCVSFAIGCEGE